MKAHYELSDLKSAAVDLENAADYLEEFREEFSGKSEWLELYTIWKLVNISRDLVEEADILVRQFRLRTKKG